MAAGQRARAITKHWSPSQRQWLMALKMRHAALARRRSAPAKRHGPALFAAISVVLIALTVAAFKGGAWKAFAQTRYPELVQALKSGVEDLKNRP
jgi:hypothetical protein